MGSLQTGVQIYVAVFINNIFRLLFQTLNISENLHSTMGVISSKDTDRYILKFLVNVSFALMLHLKQWPFNLSIGHLKALFTKQYFIVICS